MVLSYLRDDIMLPCYAVPIKTNRTGEAWELLEQSNFRKREQKSSNKENEVNINSGAARSEFSRLRSETEHTFMYSAKSRLCACPER